VASFENDAAGNWFLLVEEGRDPGAVIASVIDDVAGAAESPRSTRAARRSLLRARRVLRRSAAGSSGRQRAWVGAGESSRAAHRRGRARGPRRHPHARGERAVRPLRRRRRLFSVAGRSGPAPIATGTVQRREPTLSLTKYRGRRPVTFRSADFASRGPWAGASPASTVPIGRHSGSKRSVLLAGTARAAQRLSRASETLGSDDERA
jgi:hypothetical protein